MTVLELLKQALQCYYSYSVEGSYQNPGMCWCIKVITKLSAYILGWQYDIGQCMRNNYTWNEIKKTIFRLSKQITDEDMEFVYKVATLFKGNTKTVKWDKLLPLMQDYLAQCPI